MFTFDAAYFDGAYFDTDTPPPVTAGGKLWHGDRFIPTGTDPIAEEDDELALLLIT